MGSNSSISITLSNTSTAITAGQSITTTYQRQPSSICIGKTGIKLQRESSNAGGILDKMSSRIERKIKPKNSGSSK